MKTLALAVIFALWLPALAIDPVLEAHLRNIQIQRVDPQSVPTPPPVIKLPPVQQPVVTPPARVAPTMSAQRYMRTQYVPTEGELIAEETRRMREEMERFRQMEYQRMMMEQQREFYRQQRAAQQRAIDSTNRAARGR